MVTRKLKITEDDVVLRKEMVKLCHKVIDSLSTLDIIGIIANKGSGIAGLYYITGVHDVERKET